MEVIARSPFDHQRVLDLLPDAVIAASSSNEITYANAAVQKLLGWSPEDLLGKPITTIMPARMRETHLAGFRRYLATSVPKVIGRTIRVPALRKDGSEVEVELTLSVLRADREPIFVGSMRSVSGRIWLEDVRGTVDEALSGSFRRVREAQKWATVLPIVLMAVLSAIAVFQVRSLVSDLEWVDHTDRVIAKANETRRRVIDLETGKRGYVITGDRVFLEPYGKAIAVLDGLYRDLGELVEDDPEQVHRVEEIRAREAEWRRYAREMIDLREKGGDYASLALTMRGKEQMDDIRALFARLVDVEERLRDERSTRAQREALGSVAFVGSTLLLGTALLVFFYRRQLRSISTSYEKAFEDRATLLLREKAAREQAEAAVRARDVFLSVASHELRTPLTPLTLHIQGLERMLEKEEEPLPTPRIVEKLLKAEAQVAHLDHLVNNLLDVSRLTEKRPSLNLEPVDLASLVNEVVERKRPEIDNARCPVAVKTADGIVGEWDRLRLDQVVMNLLDNAVKYGAGRPIEVEVRATETEAVLAIRDHGIGISPEDQERIFGRFERAVPERSYGGFGLGLWISRQVIEAMGGRIGVTSKVDEGASFTVVLPRTAAARV